MGVEVDERCRNDDTGTKLLQDNEDDVVLTDQIESCGEDWRKDSEATSDKDHEKEADTEWYVVFSVRRVTLNFFRFASAYAMSKIGQFEPYSVTKKLTQHQHENGSSFQCLLTLLWILPNDRPHVRR